jgi:DNA-binding NarL/FixJ family response regulator
MSIVTPTRILVIDEIPPIAVGLQEVFRSVNPSVQVEYCDNVFTALSASSYADATFDLVIIGSFQEPYSMSLEQTVSELKERFGQPRLMIYTSDYDPFVIEKMIGAGIDAYVHKHESVDELRKAYGCLSAGERFISGIFHTLYYDYGYGIKK